MQDPQAALARLQPTSALQRTLGNTFEQLLSGQRPAGQTAGAAAQIMDLLGGSPGKGVLDALGPLFSRNLAEANAGLAQFGGPRFASQTLNAQRQLSERALQDFNLFGANVVENAIGRNLGALSDILGKAGGFAQGERGSLDALLSQLLGGSLTAGGLNQPAQFVQQPSALGQIGSLVGAVAPFLIPGGQAAGAMNLASLGANAAGQAQGVANQISAQPWWTRPTTRVNF